MLKKDMLLRSFLSVPPGILREHIRLSRFVKRCWVCGRRLTRGTGLRRRSGACPGAFLPLWQVPGSAWGTARRLKKVAKGDGIMGWKDSREDVAKRGGKLFLKKDKEKRLFVPISEPSVASVEGFQKGSTKTVYPVLALSVPVGDDSRVQSLEMGARMFANYAAQVGEGHECNSIVEIVRHGKPKSLDTTYAFRIVRALKAGEVKLVKKVAADMEAVPF